PLEQARTEVLEETGLPADRLQLVAEGSKPVYARERSKVYVVHSFLFRTVQPSIQLDWEHDALRWVDPGELSRFPTVPKLEKVWSLLAPTGAPRRAGNKN
ncbi:MAG TPA: NUDIX domain-containing protein, partial [Thermoplasmata archaeon]|nr:NUDIX domain-containing protein [Thermoplasmata archaeon]